MKKPERRISWKDTNMALVGSDLDRKIKQAAAALHEPQWTGAGESAMLRVWRIEQFVVRPWPPPKYGRFHTGDSYVILHSYQPDPRRPKLHHDIHIWIGNESTQDEYGTAAYKMVELDDKLGGAAVQHRQVQGSESKSFLGYFHEKVVYLSGGVATGFTHVEPTRAEPHLYRLKGTHKAMTLTQLPVRRDSMNAGDVFVLVAGQDRVWMWMGSESNKFEQTQGQKVAKSFCAKGNVVVLEQGQNDGEEECADFWAYMPRHVSTLGIFKKTLHIQEADEKDERVKAFVPVLFRLSDTPGGSLTKVATATSVAVGPSQATTSLRIPNAKLQPQHGYLLDTGFHVYLWIGNQVTSKHVRVYAIPQSSEYFKDYKRPLLPVTLLKASNPRPAAFEDCFYNAPESQSCCAIL